MRQYLFSGLCSNAWQFLQSPRLLFYVLLYFMAVLVVGTLAQKYIGLFPATHLFFNAFFYWLGPVPIPAGATVLTVLFINLVAHFITSSKWQKEFLGSTLAHLSILILLVGGGVTLLTKQEGFMLLLPHQEISRIYDYHLRDIILFKNDHPIATIAANHLHHDTRLDLPASLPFDIRVKMLCKNCTLDQDGTLEQRPVNLEDEINQWGVEFLISDKQDGNTATISTTEFLAPLPVLPSSKSDTSYFIALRRQSRDLPFALRLENFIPTYYAGTDIAQSYESSLHIIEDNHPSWPALIAMNDPLRYRGYTFYQSSFLQLPDQQTASVLNVVKNSGWLFPYIATALLCAGLLIHLGVRRHAPR